MEGGSGPDQDQEQQAEEVEGGQGGEGRGRQGGAEEQGEHWQDGKVRSHLFRSLKLMTKVRRRRTLPTATATLPAL